MMIDFRAFYQFGFFLPHGIIASSEMTARLMRILSPQNMIPATKPAIQIGFVGSNQVANIQQLQFVSIEKGISIVFEPNRYLIQMNSNPKARLPEIALFRSLAYEIVSLLEKEIALKANRMSFVTRGLCKKMQQEELNNANKSLFILPERIKKLSPFSWNSRQICREKQTINEKDETINIVMDVNRIQTMLNFDNNLSEYDGLEIGFDINTFQGNNMQRFNSNDITPFLSSAWETSIDLEKSIEQMVGVAKKEKSV